MSSDEFVERWAEFVRTDSNWKKIHTEFINAQFEKSEQFLKRLVTRANGREKIIHLFDIKNLEGYSDLLGEAKQNP